MAPSFAAASEPGHTTEMSNFEIVHVAGDDDLEDVRALFLDYAASIGFSLAFQGFDRELAELPGRYAPPGGLLLLVRVAGEVAGCGAFRRLDEQICEMKRLFVRPAFHGRGLGRRIAEELIEEGHRGGYAAMRLDTVPTMNAAIRLYESLGFLDIEPYIDNPIDGARFMELRLSKSC